MSKTTANTERSPPLKARWLIHLDGERRLAHLLYVSTSAFDFSYLMDDLRHWQLVHVRVRLLLRLFIHRAGRQRHTELEKQATTAEMFLTGEERF